MWREVTADFVYVRLHGHTRKYASSYSSAALRRWASDARAWRDAGKEVFVYFDNDAEGHAVANARRFAELVAVSRPDRAPLLTPSFPVTGKPRPRDQRREPGHPRS